MGSTLDSALMVEKLINQSAVGVGVASSGSDDEDDDDESAIRELLADDSERNVLVPMDEIVAVALTTARRSIFAATRGMRVAMETSVAERGAESLESSSPFPIIPEKCDK